MFCRGVPAGALAYGQGRQEPRCHAANTLPLYNTHTTRHATPSCHHNRPSLLPATTSIISAWAGKRWRQRNRNESYLLAHKVDMVGGLPSTARLFMRAQSMNAPGTVAPRAAAQHARTGAPPPPCLLLHHPTPSNSHKPRRAGATTHTLNCPSGQRHGGTFSGGRRRRWQHHYPTTPSH